MSHFQSRIRDSLLTLLKDICGLLIHIMVLNSVLSKQNKILEHYLLQQRH
jgi:hypothetical protein